MMRKAIVGSLVGLLVLSLGLACNKKKAEAPASLDMIPADADIVGTMDAAAFIKYAKSTLAKLVPAEMKAQIPTVEAMTEQVLKMSGIDINNLGKITFIGYVGSEDKMAFIVDGLSVKSLTGQKAGDHNGVALFSMPQGVHYADLGAKGVLGAPNADMLKKVLDVHAGKSKSLSGSDRGKILAQLSALESDLSQFRLYLLTGDVPGAAASPFKTKGGGFFLHLDKGLAGTVLSDDAGAAQIKTQLDQGLTMAKMAMAAPDGAMPLPVKLDADTKKMITEVLGKLESAQKGSSVSIAYHGDLKPVIEKAVATGMAQYTAGAQAPTAVPAPPKPQK